MRSLISKIELGLVILAAIFGLIVLPGLNIFTPETSALHISNFTISLYGKYLCYAVVAMSVDMLWGYTGLLCLGQCLFFALGGYAFGMYLMLHICELGQYHSPLPDFMVFLGYPTLPAHWLPFSSLWFSLLAVVLVPGIIALLFGFLAFRSRIRGVYFSILTQALTYAACILFFRNDLTLGGNNGLTDFKFLFATPQLAVSELKEPPALETKLKSGADPVSTFLWSALTDDTKAKITSGAPDAATALTANLNNVIAIGPIYDATRFAGVKLTPELQKLAASGPKDTEMLRTNRLLLEAAYPAEIAKKSFTGYAVNDPNTQRGLYLATVLLMLGTYAVCKWITTTKFGKVQRAIRDSENRVLFSGYATANFKLFIFVLSAIIAGLAGALYVPQVGIINPSEMATDKSLEAVVWVAVGGRGTLIGPVIGAIFVNAMKSWATVAFPDLWLIILGGSFILVVLFMPKGIVGVIAQIAALFTPNEKLEAKPETEVKKPAEPATTIAKS
jgi:ABC-type branched-subunit amino acid transport system permease subunit